MTIAGPSFSRREVAMACGALGAASLAPALAASAQPQPDKPLRARPIPHDRRETLPVVGLGTARVFDVGAGAEAGPAEVVRALVAGGGALIDTAPSYGEAETVVGDIVATNGLRPRVFIATKLENLQPGRAAAQAQASLARLKTRRIDLLQLHNVVDPNQDMGGLDALKASGVCRYTGVTTTFKDAYPAAEAILRRAKPDFLEIDYAIDDRDAEDRLLPAAADVGAGVIVALPFGRGRLFRSVIGKPLPAWAADFDCASWSQFFLKFILANPAVSAVIPGTGNAAHMVDNLGAGRGRLPDAEQRVRMIRYVESLGA